MASLVRRYIVVVGLVGARHARTIVVGEDVDHAFDRKRRAGVDVRNASLGDRRGDDAGIGQALGR